ncbi:MAG: ribonuclease P protein component [Dehalococcoidia bacterium]
MPRGRLGRLRKGAEFDSVFSKGSVVNGPLLVVRVSPNGGTLSRWGFAVGKKLVPKATGRNLLRRRLREAARAIVLSRGLDVVVVARFGAREASVLELEGALRKQLSKLGAEGTDS